MERKLYSFELLAHPDELLITHSKNVAEISLERFKSIKHNLNKILKPTIWEDLVYITGFSHDLGKATSYFQQYIKASDEEKERLKNQPETHHGLLGAIFTYWLIKTYLGKRQIEDKHPLVEFLPFLFFLIVKKHHGDLGNPLNDELFGEQFDYLEKQISTINKEELEHFLHSLSDNIKIEFDLCEFPKDIKLFVQNELKSPIKSTSIRKIFKDKFPQNIDSYVIFQFFYSLLLQSDKESVILERKSKKRNFIEPDIVCKYKEKKFGTPKLEIDKIRENIFQDALHTIENADLNQKIFSLNVPTGTGKTLTSLSVALKLRERLKNEEGFLPRIIYSLPFTSIIDQNYDVFNDVFNNPPSDLLLKHHHLADVVYKTKSEKNEEYDTNQAQFLIETWESEIIVTTFVQLFHTLLTNRNRSLKKFHKLANSIILLDEVQTIPIKYWLLVREVFKTLTEVFNSYIILITATQPRIFPENEIMELVPQKHIYFSKLNRVQLEFVHKDLPLKEFQEMLYNEISNSDKSFLIVMNTITSSLELYNALIRKEIDGELFYLSTNIIPKERLKRIQEIKTETKRRIIISTQLVEAGVDIDVENVWRDFGPLDSINQVSGRCNRNFAGELGNVKIIKLKDDKDRYFYRYIYGDSILQIMQTNDVFNENRLFKESEFLENISKYYKDIEDRMSDADSEKIICDVEKLQFDEIAKFRLIENEEYYKKDIFIEIDEEATTVWQKFIQIREMPLVERKLAFLKIKKDFYDYVISVPAKYVKESEYENTGVVYISKEEIESCYDEKTGWKRDEQGCYVF